MLSYTQYIYLYTFSLLNQKINLSISISLQYPAYMIHVHCFTLHWLVLFIPRLFPLTLNNNISVLSQLLISCKAVLFRRFFGSCPAAKLLRNSPPICVASVLFKVIVSTASYMICLPQQIMNIAVCTFKSPFAFPTGSFLAKTLVDEFYHLYGIFICRLFLSSYYGYMHMLLNLLSNRHRFGPACSLTLQFFTPFHIACRTLHKQITHM